VVQSTTLTESFGDQRKELEMPRKKRTIDEVRKAVAAAQGSPGQPGGRRRRRSKSTAETFGLSREELESIICSHVGEGHPPAEIKALLKKRYKIKIPRERPYQILAAAAIKRLFQYRPPLELEMADKIRHAHHLQDVRVVHTALFQDVGYRAAENLVELVLEHAERKGRKDCVHIGFAGGYSMHKLARCFADMLREPRPGMPKAICLHAMVGGADPKDPTTDPNAFFTYFLEDPFMRDLMKFSLLHAPAIVHARQFTEIKKWEGIVEAYQEAKDLDIIVTSASHWADPHSMLYKYMRNSPSSIAALHGARCVGDMMWRPLGENGPIEFETDIRSMTLAELSDLPAFIGRGGSVMLAIGPCGGCRQPKGKILRTILNLKEPLVTHLVVDTRSAREMLSDLAQAA
jgi:DNA-binding transcriptional regulator LsrR (DeoR family)